MNKTLEKAMWEIEVPEGPKALGYKKLIEMYKLGSVTPCSPKQRQVIIKKT